MLSSDEIAQFPHSSTLIRRNSIFRLVHFAGVWHLILTRSRCQSIIFAKSSLFVSETGRTLFLAEFTNHLRESLVELLFVVLTWCRPLIALLSVNDMWPCLGFESCRASHIQDTVVGSTYSARLVLAWPKVGSLRFLSESTNCRTENLDA